MKQAKKSPNNNVIRFRSTPALKLRIAKIAAKKMLKESDILRAALSDYLSSQERLLA
jgi:predicted transcriptional regulator